MRKSRYLQSGGGQSSAAGEPAGMTKGLSPEQPEALAQADIRCLLSQISEQLSQLREPGRLNNQAAEGNAGSRREEDGSSRQQNGCQRPDRQSVPPDALAQLQRLLGQLLPADQQPAGEENGVSGSFGSSLQNQPAKATQTAAQALANAQYELANELENSLAKLRQVIGESEKLAEKISQLLGEESTSGS